MRKATSLYVLLSLISRRPIFQASFSPDTSAWHEQTFTIFLTYIKNRIKNTLQSQIRCSLIKHNYNSSSRVTCTLWSLASHANVAAVRVRIIIALCNTRCQPVTPRLWPDHLIPNTFTWLTGWAENFNNHIVYYCILRYWDLSSGDYMLWP